jgi:hypothetical protein
MSDRDYVYEPATTPFEPRAESYNANNALCLAAASNLGYEDSSTIEPVVKQWEFGNYRFVEAKGTQGTALGQPYRLCDRRPATFAAVQGPRPGRGGASC